MSAARPPADWLTAQEIADARLPGVPHTRRGVHKRAIDDHWMGAERGALSRSRTARGGGTEYHFSLLPEAAQLALSRRAPSQAEPPIAAANDSAELPSDAAERWSLFSRQPAGVKAKAERRSRIVQEVEAIVAAGLTKSAAVAEASSRWGEGKATIWGWLRIVAGVPASDRLPYLAPGYKGGGKAVEIDADVWDSFLGDYLRLDKPPLAACYWRLQRWAAEHGRTIPSEKTLARRIAKLDRTLLIDQRHGRKAALATVPAQQRTVASSHALEIVNVDGHQIDVFVRFPDGVVRRPIMVAIQDVYSRKLLAWRIGETENVTLTRLAFADVLKRYGIPKHCLFDNGRAFASKALTGGARTRFRGKIRDEDPTGLLTSLGVDIHFATPAHGQAKPVERFFGTFAGRISKHPLFAGAYTGNKPEAKPENYGERAIEWSEFLRVVNAELIADNAKPGRDTEMARGIHSLDQVFDASYAVSPIRKAVPEQLDLALLAMEQVRTDRKSGFVKLFGGRFWAPELSQIAGQPVTVRFDPDDLTRPLRVYTLDGRLFASAPMIEATDFLSEAGAKEHGRRKAEVRRHIRREAEALNLLHASKREFLLPSAPIDPDPPEARVVQPVRHRSRGGAGAAVQMASESPSPNSVIDRLAAAADRRLRLIDREGASS